MKIKTALVLGSSGQIGRELVKLLRNEGIHALELDIKVGAEQDLRTFNNAYLDECMRAADFIFFLAFDVGGSKYLHDKQFEFDFISNNSRIMENTFESIRRYKKPFIFASTQMSSMTDSAYGVLKLIGEFYTNSLNGLVIKLWNVYGIEEQDEKSHVITDFIKKAHKEKVIQMITDGQEERQFLHASDCSKCLLSLMRSYDVIPRSEKLHITSFKWTKILDIANYIAEFFPGTKVLPGLKKDLVQNGVRNEPSEFILNFWKPAIIVQKGIEMVIQELKLR